MAKKQAPKRSKLGPAALAVAGIAGGVVAAVRKRAGKEAAPGSGGTSESQRRYAAPAEAGSQPPATTGGTPSDAPPIPPAPTAASDPAGSLHTKPHDLPPDVVMPDVSDDDPAVRAAEAAAAADAGSIGGNVDQLAADEPGFPEDAATRPVIEGSGDAEESFEARDAELGGNRETQP